MLPLHASIHRHIETLRYMHGEDILPDYPILPTTRPISFPLQHLSYKGQFISYPIQVDGIWQFEYLNNVFRAEESALERRKVW
eukprot:CAMPEP_0117422136 /NCGR_PEP_ID=MMETSP0758-20121206/3041_1 /TAXON_ID=63605 /ORGANISM="Percolomonas cosmopolitus, Strain AE-1 (ATCC 50343)" /LENGTH=82 /DNA_ID=CAMNT_0005204585 /DNA_START=837 /DNA_END=1082 /DNA_ORIENTATION=-